MGAALRKFDNSDSNKRFSQMLKICKNLRTGRQKKNLRTGRP